MRLIRASIARPHGRARIETPPILQYKLACGCIARPHGRARIETHVLAYFNGTALTASPDLTVGRGLKHPGRGSIGP